MLQPACSRRQFSSLPIRAHRPVFSRHVRTVRLFATLPHGSARYGSARCDGSLRFATGPTGPTVHGCASRFGSPATSQVPPTRYRSLRPVPSSRRVPSRHARSLLADSSGRAMTCQCRATIRIASPRASTADQPCQVMSRPPDGSSLRRMSPCDLPPRRRRWPTCHTQSRRCRATPRNSSCPSYAPRHTRTRHACPARLRLPRCCSATRADFPCPRLSRQPTPTTRAMPGHVGSTKRYPSPRRVPHRLLVA